MLEIDSTLRKLTHEEIGQLVMQGCECEDWNKVQVKEGFICENIRNTKFSGTIKLGLFEEEVFLFGGIKFKTGIYNAWLHNCTIEDNVLIHNVRSYIANYTISSRSVIHNITTLAVDGETAFGNGTEVEAINEGGGRKVPVYDHLSTHVAYIFALYRHRHQVIESLEKLVANYVSFVKSTTGHIGPGTKILNCDTIKDVKTGPGTHIEGARKLQNGSINSSFEDPVIIGDNVIMENFIVCSGSKVTGATLVSNSFIGQGCILDKHYSAEHSLFFANCQGFHGEACSIFAGPYTVTHHKSTLLIAGMFSFLNAGSGSNQSNHLYKLGPIHQGIIERGAKTTSDSYLLWPSHIGAFSLVMGRHYKHSDTSNFPFSYIIESNDESILVPAINLRSIGIIRDSQKWPQRDIRKDPNKLDYINFNLLSPYTVQKMIGGRQILLDIRKTSGTHASEYVFQNMKIRKKSLERGIKLYEMAIYKFLGNSLITKLQGKNYQSEGMVREALKKDTPIGTGKWIDLSGMICPAEALEQLMKSIENHSITSLEEINSMLQSIHENYYNYEWTWAYDIFESFYGKQPDKFSIDDVIQLIEKWKHSVLDLDKLLYEDARKEFSLITKTGFGLDGEEEDKNRDFESVRGDFETHSTVVAIKKHMENKEKLGDSIIGLMNQVVQSVSN